MFNDLAVHVAHIDGSIRSRAHHRRTKPVVGTGEKFGGCFFRSPLSTEGDATACEHQTRYQIMNRLACQRISVPAASRQRVAVDGCAAGRSEPVDAEEIVEARHRAAHRVHSGSSRFRRDLGAQGSDSGKRIPLGIPAFHHVVPDRIRIVVSEPLAEIVPFAAELSLTGNCFQASAVRMESQIAKTDADAVRVFGVVHRFRTLRTGSTDNADLPAAVSVGQVQPAVQSPPQSVDPMLLIAF